MTRHYRLLTRHFFRGFLENDVLSPDEGMQATLAPLLAAIAAPGLLLPRTGRSATGGRSSGQPNSRPWRFATRSSW